MDRLLEYLLGLENLAWEANHKGDADFYAVYLTEDALADGDVRGLRDDRLRTPRRGLVCGVQPTHTRRQLGVAMSQQRVRLHRWIAATVVAVLAAGFVVGMPLPAPPADAAAAEIAPSAGDGAVDATGRFSTSIPFDVPGFRGLEPELGLSYDSGTGNGFTGMGWTLTGQSFVERAGVARGVVRYYSNDIFLLDGQELVACTTFGGTHCTRQQSFQRIRRDEAQDRWEVWDTDGTRSVYTPVFPTAYGTFRWGLLSETDTHGNTVSYSYWRGASPENAYLDSISYNGTTIKLWRESRADEVSFSNGAFVGKTTQRLKTVEISTGGSRVRAYQLSYGTASSTGRSRLTSVRQYGRDASLDGSGTVTGGTALPPVTMTWQDGLARLNQDTSFNGTVGGWNPTTIDDLFGDVNGDGRTDLVRIYKMPDSTQAGAHVRPSSGAGYPTFSFDSEVGGWNTETKNHLADITGDGRADLVRLYKCATTAQTCAYVRPSNGDGFAGVSFDGPLGSWSAVNRDFFADVNGDSRADFVRIWKSADNAEPPKYFASAQVNLSDGGGFGDQSFNGVVDKWRDSAMDYLPDVTGDGRADLVIIYDDEGGAGAKAKVRVSNGAGFEELTFDGPVGGFSPNRVHNHFADVNGDGKADLIRLWNNGSAFAQVSLSTGTGYPAVSWNSSVGGWDPATVRDFFADVNGDGRADLVRVYKREPNSELYVQIRPFDGRGFEENSFNGHLGTWSAASTPYLVDVSGDGKTDLVYLWHNGSAYAKVNLALGQAPDLLASMSNGIGGTASVQYTPSTTWWSAGHNLPAVFPTVRSVTRADGHDTSFTAQHSFADGAWARQPDERRFLGFGRSTVVLDADGTNRETFYRQSLAGAGKPDRQYLKDPAGRTYWQDQWTYAENGAAPYTSQLASRSRFECNLTAYCRQARTDFTYDGYSNVLSEVNQGDAARTGDETRTAYTYAPNTTAYIVSAPATVTRHAGTTTWARLTRSVYFYDNATSSATSPTRGDRTRVDEWNSTTGGYVSTAAGYDTWGNVISATDARGFTSTTTFDPTYHLFPLRGCNALNQCAVTTFDYPLGQADTVTDPNNAVTDHDSDPLGRPRTRKDPAGNITSWQYLDVGNPNTQRVREILPDGTADGLWSETFFDGLGRAWQTIKEGPAAGSTYVQDRVYRSTTAQVWKQSLWRLGGQPARYTVSTYDGADRLIRTTLPDGAFARLVYDTGADAAPYVTGVDELGHEKTSWSDVHGQLNQVREKNGTAVHTTAYRHDLLGRLTGWTDAAGNTSTVDYNSLGWKTSMTDMDTGTWTYGYDNGGLVTTQKDAKNQTTTFGYDALGRPAAQTYHDSSQARWFYDETGHGASVGRLTRATYPAGSDTHTWNALGQETATTQCVDTVCKSMSTGYDTLGRLKTLTYPDNEVVGYTYNAAGQLAAVAGYVNSMTWNPAGQLTGLTHPNGTSATYTYDPNREWLDTATVAGPSGTPYQASYDYNPAGLVTTMTQGTPTPATTSYTYDDLNRLLTVSGAQAQTFAYNVIGNITSNSAVGSYGYGDPAHKHAATSAGTASYVYDPNGNMTSGDGRTLVWDSSNRLTSVSRAGAATTFAYDAGERRLKKTTGASTARYFSTYVEESGGTLTKYYYAGPILVARSSGGVKTWYHADRLGSTRLMTNSSGAEVRDYDYTAFGEHTTTGTATNERTYTGHIHDDTTGLTYMLARYQDPKLGRFISPDSIIPNPANPQDINRYSYVNDNPINNTDPTGHGPIPGCPDGCEWRTTPPPPAQPAEPIGHAPGCPDGCAHPGQKPPKNSPKMRRTPDIGSADKGDRDSLARNLYIYGTPCADVQYANMDAGCAVSSQMNEVARVLHADWLAFANSPGGQRLGLDLFAACIEGDEASCAVLAVTFAARGRGKGKERSCVANSFTGDTRVLMADGTKKRINEVVVGDEVMATDPATGQTQPKRVTATILGRGEKRLVEVTVESIGSAAAVTATEGHPFWVESQVRWLDAAQLQPGDLLAAPDGARLRVIAVVAYGASATVHNLTVADIHTYYVLAGKTPILVHNDGGLTPEQERSLRSLQARSAEHQAKLDAYRANPHAYDNDGRLGRATSPEMRQSIIDGRIKKLEREISGFNKQVDDLKKLGGMC